MASPIVFVMYVILAAFAVSIAWKRFDRNNRGEVKSRTLRRVLNIGAIIGFLPLMVMAVFARIPTLPVRIMPLNLWPLIEREYWLPFAVLFFATASQLVSKPNRRALAVLASVLVLFVAGVTSWRLFPLKMHDFGRNMIDGVCTQSTGYTCGAASLVTLLDQMGIHATEGEMAQLSGTIPGRGVSDLQAAYGLQQKLNHLNRSERVQFVICRDGDPRAAAPPFLASMKHSFWFDHMVCVMSMDEDDVVIGDPLGGKRRMPMHIFRNEWRGIAINASAPK